jgi:hypothetical protein
LLPLLGSRLPWLSVRKDVIEGSLHTRWLINSLVNKAPKVHLLALTRVDLTRLYLVLGLFILVSALSLLAILHLLKFYLLHSIELELLLLKVVIDHQESLLSLRQLFKSLQELIIE